jgi:hypothetical protein
MALGGESATFKTSNEGPQGTWGHFGHSQYFVPIFLKK